MGDGEGDSEHGKYLGRQNAETGAVRLCRCLRLDQFFWVTAHELGHTFGLGHEDEALMSGDNSMGYVTGRDVEHFDRLWAER